VRTVVATRIYSHPIVGVPLVELRPGVGLAVFKAIRVVFCSLLVAFFAGMLRSFECPR